MQDEDINHVSVNSFILVRFQVGIVSHIATKMSLPPLSLSQLNVLDTYAEGAAQYRSSQIMNEVKSQSEDNSSPNVGSVTNTNRSISPVKSLQSPRVQSAQNPSPRNQRRTQPTPRSVSKSLKFREMENGGILILNSEEGQRSKSNNNNENLDEFADVDDSRELYPASSRSASRNRSGSGKQKNRNQSPNSRSQRKRSNSSPVTEVLMRFKNI